MGNEAFLRAAGRRGCPFCVLALDYRRQDAKDTKRDHHAYQNASCTEPLPPIHHISMLFGMRDTAVIPPFVDALPAGATSNRCQAVWPSYQKASFTEPLAPAHHISMLLGMRDTAVIPPFVDALPAGAISIRCQAFWPSYQKASCTEPLAPISPALDKHSQESASSPVNAASDRGVE